MKESNKIKEEWNAVIAEKLKAGVTIDDLKHEYAEGIVMEPNVMKSDLASYTHSIAITKPWVNMAEIKNGSGRDKNKLVLQSLQEGANGLSIELSNQDSISDILEGVLTSYLDVRIDCSALNSEEFINQKSSIDPSDFPNVRWINGTSEFKQIRIGETDRITEIKACLDSVQNSKNVDVIVTLSKNLLFEIASLRAIRSLLDELSFETFNVLANYNIEGTNELGDYNLIEKTYKVISGVLGGANAVMTDYKGDEDSRLTLNIHNVLDLESGMKNVMDPIGGSFYLEKLTGEIIQKAKA